MQASPTANAATAATTPAAPVAPAPAPTVTEVVHRPDPGIGRGVWEASPAFFWIVLAVAAIATASMVLGTRARARKSAAATKEASITK